MLLTLAPTQNEQWYSAVSPSTVYRYCANAQHNACNWLIPANSEDQFCLACQLNHVIPDLTVPENLERWRKIEIAKHRLLYSLLQFKLPVVTKSTDPDLGLAFDFLSDSPATGDQAQNVTTGHADGLITMNIKEADDAQREQIRQSLAEPYRTLLGHFRHEIAHYYWMRFAHSPSWLAAFREIFGDERQDYGQALTDHYNEPSANGETDVAWREEYISAYAEAHPWEDWAETWAHYFHIVDTLETAYAFGIRINPKVATDESLVTEMSFNAYHQPDFDSLVAAWLPVTFAVNSLNRAMGHLDLYPFVLSQSVLDKMAFIHKTILSGAENGSS